jgi:hypothetical protein
MPTILTIRHWQIILLIFALMLPFGITVQLLSHFLPYRWASSFFDLLSLGLLVSYPFLVWNKLNTLLRGETLYERTERKSMIILIALVGAAQIVRMAFPYQPPRYVAAGVFVISFTLLCAAPAKQLKSIELKRNAGVWEYVPEAFLFFMWPLGVLWLQPRVNEVQGRRIVIRE